MNEKKIAENCFDNYPDILTPDQARRLLGVGKNKIYEHLVAGRIRSVKNGRKYLIPKTAILDFLNGLGYDNGYQH